MLQFKITQYDTQTKARTGIISTSHGELSTPVFMPVGTLGAVKGIGHEQLQNDIGASIFLCNTYHMYLRPGNHIIQQAGGLHKFIGSDLPLLTDSGGYQVFSLAENRKITEEGAQFKSHIDGSKHLFTPENVVDTQRILGSDIMMAFDECTPYPCEYSDARKSMELTHRWLARGVARFKETTTLYDHNQTFFPIVQGSVYKDLRKQSAETIAAHDLAGNAIGGLSVGEPEELMYEMLETVNEILPSQKPRYLMGVGTPVNIIQAISLGVDMFDCVMPTRNGRNGMLFTAQGIINIKNKKWESDFSPIDPEGTTSVDTRYSKAFLRHLFVSGEMLGGQIASIHNLGFYMRLMQAARDTIKNGTFAEWKHKMIPSVSTRL